MEYLYENSNRSFPFVEDSVHISSNGFLLKNDFLVDIKIVSRIGISNAWISKFSPRTNSLILSVLIRENNSTINIPISIPTNAEFPYYSAAAHQDPDYPSYAQINVNAVFGQSAIEYCNSLYNLPDFNFDQLSTPIEPSCIIDISGSIVDLIGAIRRYPDPRWVVEGDVYITGGYNTKVIQSGSDIEISTDYLNGGQLGPYLGEIGSSSCDGVVFTINGLPPEDRGKFKVSQGSGVYISNNPDQNSISISVDRLKRLGNSCQ